MSFLPRGIVFFIVVLAGFYSIAEAHPPQGIELEYNSEESILNVKVQHISKSPKNHYIRKVELFKGEEKIDEQFFVWQKFFGVDLDFNIAAEEGDEFKVKAICNKGGSKKEKLIISLENNKQEKKK